MHYQFIQLRWCTQIEVIPMRKYTNLYPNDIGSTNGLRQCVRIAVNTLNALPIYSIKVVHANRVKQRWRSHGQMSTSSSTTLLDEDLKQYDVMIMPEELKELSWMCGQRKLTSIQLIKIASRCLLGTKLIRKLRTVSKKEGIDFAREYGCLFLECSAKTCVNVEQCFEELVLKILETPSLLAEGSAGLKKNTFECMAPPADASTNSYC
ncbi:hypothetical protein IEQ34_011823 [Dendrobium chrysotoxum]|uniref:Uncharacterized protein n=1 Tax=Dendrobium chrysotoxum TaxID=161865 RepID=A0AAV7GTC8_DENCH|nr:hypothetical protein IEQ34_011823 [Dendrobium chrysotoxum]